MSLLQLARDTAASVLDPELPKPAGPEQPEQRRGRAGEHTEHLAELLAELQSVARADPEATW